MQETPFVESILHPSDFTEDGHGAFVHALALALYRRASFEILHVVSETDPLRDWSHAPRIRKTLEQWGLLEPGSPRDAVMKKLALEVGKINIRRRDPAKAIVSDIEMNPVDLVVLATEGRDGLPRWLKPSVAETVARAAKTMTLFVPKGVSGFVSPEDGKVNLKRVLVPIDRKPDPQDAVTYAARAAVMSLHEPVEIVLLHVGGADAPPWPKDLPGLQTCTWQKLRRDGNPIESIVEVADEIAADLIIMATEGRKGILGTLRGSVTEKVLRRAPCPLLAVPAKA